MLISSVLFIILACLFQTFNCHQHSAKKLSDCKKHDLHRYFEKKSHHTKTDVLLRPVAQVVNSQGLEPYDAFSKKKSSQKVRRSLDQIKLAVIERMHQSNLDYLETPGLLNFDPPLTDSNSKNNLKFVSFKNAETKIPNVFYHELRRFLKPYIWRNMYRPILLGNIKHNKERILKIRNQELSSFSSHLRTLNENPYRSHRGYMNVYNPHNHFSKIKSHNQDPVTTVMPHTINWNGTPNANGFPTFPPEIISESFTDAIFNKSGGASNKKNYRSKSNFNLDRPEKGQFSDKHFYGNIYKNLHQHFRHLERPHNHHLVKSPHHHHCNHFDDNGNQIPSLKKPRCHHILSTIFKHSDSPKFKFFNGINQGSSSSVQKLKSNTQELRNEFQFHVESELDDTSNISTSGNSGLNKTIELTKNSSTPHIHINHELVNPSGIGINERKYKTPSESSSSPQDKVKGNKKDLCTDGGTIEVPLLNIDLPCGDLSGSRSNTDDYYKREFAKSMTQVFQDYVEKQREKEQEEKYDIDVRLGRSKRNTNNKKHENNTFNSSYENKTYGKGLKVDKELNGSVFGEIMDVPKDLTKNDTVDYFDLSMLSEYFLEAVESLDEASLVDVLKALKEDYLSKSPSDQMVVDEVYEKLVSSLLDYKRANGNWAERRRRESPSKAKRGPAAVLELLAETDKHLESEMQDDPFANDYYGEYNDRDPETSASDASFLELVSLADKHKSNVKF